ncbi:MAG: hypothetical protein E7197_06340 [Anaerovibrio sp.]|uniref:hypothetical protein n=1 Tax=Anaerovibrio sp. TaxID=1872532 RepID=UPI0025C32958|nr:hypothetical protein [Anaerovibrio sp.]MBE6099659.1 hypothetical protein [Anaerovibrio sp.]
MGKVIFRIFVSMAVLISFVASSMVIQQYKAEASFKTIKRETKREVSPTGVFVFKAEGEPIKIRIKQDILDQKYYVLAFRDGKKIFDEAQSVNESSWRIQEIQDNDSGRIFYCIAPGTEPDYALLMGYDPEKKKWMIYIDSRKFDNDVHGAALLGVDDKGELGLTFSTPGEASHSYDFFWDKDSSWFGYKDLGVKGQIVAKPKKEEKKNVWFYSAHGFEYWLTVASPKGNNTYAVSVTATHNGKFHQLYIEEIRSDNGVAYTRQMDRYSGNWSSWDHSDYAQAMWQAVQKYF